MRSGQQGSEHTGEEDAVVHAGAADAEQLRVEAADLR